MAQGSATIDFGATPTDVGTVAVTGQGAILATSSVEAFIMAETSADHTAEDHKALALMARLVCDVPVAATGFNIQIFVLGGKFAGRYTVRWVWN